jgi:hypothetical protein
LTISQAETDASTSTETETSSTSLEIDSEPISILKCRTHGEIEDLEIPQLPDITEMSEFPPEPEEKPFVYSVRNMQLPLSIHKSLNWVNSSRNYEELLHVYIHKSAPRLDSYSPNYIELWRSYVPAMAFGPNGSAALLNAMAALAALQLAPFQRDPPNGYDRAERYYIAALQDHQILDSVEKDDLDDSMLATALLLAHYEAHLKNQTVSNQFRCGMEN